MKSSVLTTKGWALLFVAAVLVATGTLNFAQRLTHRPPPTDGVEWVDTADGVVATGVQPDSAAGRQGVFGIKPGDRIIAIGEQEKPDRIYSANDVQMYLEEAGVGGRVRYLVDRPS